MTNHAKPAANGQSPHLFGLLLQPAIADVVHFPMVRPLLGPGLVLPDLPQAVHPHQLFSGGAHQLVILFALHQPVPVADEVQGERAGVAVGGGARRVEDEVPQGGFLPRAQQPGGFRGGDAAVLADHQNGRVSRIAASVQDDRPDHHLRVPGGLHLLLGAPHAAPELLLQAHPQAAPRLLQRDQHQLDRDPPGRVRSQQHAADDGVHVRFRRQDPPHHVVNIRALPADRDARGAQRLRFSVQHVPHLPLPDRQHVPQLPPP